MKTESWRLCKEVLACWILEKEEKEPQDPLAHENGGESGTKL